MKTYNRLYEFISNLPVVSTHEHHLPDEFHKALTLDGILERSYVAWQNIPPGTTDADHEQFLKQARYNSYFVWLEKALQHLYSLTSKISAENWRALSADISKRHRKKDAHIHILKEQCRYKTALMDAYWATGSSLGHPDLFKPVARADMFTVCFHPSVHDHDNNSPWESFEISGLDFGGYLQYIETFFRDCVAKGAVAFKIASAYERTLKVQESSYEQAASVFMKDPGQVSEGEKNAYGDYIINRLCKLASELAVPVQIHTGLGRLRGSKPLLLEELIERHQDTRFVLFHGGYPWVREIAAMAHNHSNVYIDMVWLPMISTTAAEQALHEYIEVAPSSDRISWGSDTWTSEEAFGSLLAYQHVVAKVLASKVKSDYFDMEEARVLAARLMHSNAESLYL